MRIDLTETPVNTADRDAAYFVADWINIVDGTISGDLFDADGNQVARRRVYSYTGDRKKAPFADLSTAQIAYMIGGDPDKTWTAYLIGLWLDRRGIEYQDGATAAQLLALVPVPVEDVERP